MINGHVTVHHYNDTRSTDNNKRHVMAFRPISEAAHSWPYDNMDCRLFYIDRGRLPATFRYGLYEYVRLQLLSSTATIAIYYCYYYYLRLSSEGDEHIPKNCTVQFLVAKKDQLWPYMG